MMYTEVEKLTLALDGWGATVSGITINEESNPTAEQVARAVRKAIISVRRGEGRDIDLTY